MSRILVTGSNGFTGRYVYDALREVGHDVVGLVHGEPGPAEHRCDLTDGQAVDDLVAKLRPDGVIHLAAQAFVGHQDQREFYDINLFGTLNLLDAIEAHCDPHTRVIIASSANVYGAVANEHISEAVPPGPINHYAMSKLAMEYMVRARWERLPILVTRPFNYTGPGQHERFLIPKIVGHFRRNAACIELGNLDVARDFSDVRDIAAAYVALLQSDARSEVVNLCSGTVYGLGQVVAMMNALAGYEIEVKVNPDFVRADEIKRLGGDNSRYRQITGMGPAHSFADTLQNMYEAPAGEDQE